MSMTRKHYIKIADAIKESTLYDPNNKKERPKDVDLMSLVDSLCYIFKCDNSNFRKDNGVDSGLHVAILEYVKHRLEEDKGDMQKSAYFLQKYRQKVSTYSHSKKGARGILLPPM